MFNERSVKHLKKARRLMIRRGRKKISGGAAVCFYDTVGPRLFMPDRNIKPPSL